MCKYDNVLYFESCGCVEYNGINCRIRTAFINNSWDEIILEILSMSESRFRIVFAVYVNEGKYIRYPVDRARFYDGYTLENIKQAINEVFNCSFDSVVVLSRLSGYRVLQNGLKTYPVNYGDCFVYDRELTERRIKKVNELQKHFKKVFGVAHDNTSYYIEDGKLMVCINHSTEDRIKAGYPDRCFSVEV